MTSTSTEALESLSEEIKCYNLPYGALGFASHVLTYYTILCLWFGRKPLWPFSRVSYSWFDLALAKRRVKRERREASDDSGVQVEKSAVPAGDEPGSGAPDRDTAKKEDEAPIKVVLNPMRWVSWWVVLYIPGMFAGVAGLMALVVKDRRRHAGVLKLTAGFYVVVGAGVLAVIAGVLYRLRNAGDRSTARRLVFGGLVWVVGTFSILAVFYSDWALGIGDASALYWTYWISKRLPMFSL
ncbi:hypothetical protein FA13DRAFT_1765771 [Coprinellus micaceus]|uniref:Uncharacterized protein n=1 Tax=Coprinellus micaceus TaxID=71717 RepID=A0A4Y7SUB1_COPMI|nr:hypothetical protein FA13DRAFT_1765771 [Coprinellus micaceus]